MSEIDEALADVKQEGQDPFADVVATPSDSPSEKKTEADKPEEGTNTPHEDTVPFHKHPRWIERESELKTLRETEEAHAKEIAELRAIAETTQKKLEPTSTQIPDWFRELYGDNALAYQKYAEHEQVKEADIERRVLEKQSLAQQQAQEETKRWNKWVDDEIGKLEADGHTFDRNKLIKTMLEYKPTDENNNFDFKAGMKIYEALEGKGDTERSQARKILADTTTKSSIKGEKRAKDFLTAEDLRNTSWSNL